MRPPVLFPLFASVNSLKGIGAKTAGFISRLCGDRVVDLIWHLPAALIDRTYAPKLINARPNVNLHAESQSYRTYSASNPQAAV